MNDLLRRTELNYIKCFSNYQEEENIIRFRDDRLPDMYAHNFIYIKEKVSDDGLSNIVSKEIERRRKEGRDFLQLEADFPINTKAFDDMLIFPEVSIYDYMSISTDRYAELNGNADCSIEEAVTERILRDGKAADILASIPGMGEDFAQRRAARKAEAYKSRDNNLSLFVCYHNNIAIGKCELYIDDKIAKIDDFDILEQYQRKGFGTSVLKQLIKTANERGADTAYVITDDADTAKEMYNKCGFTKVGEKTSIFFALGY